jgi:hypothetical protein
MRMASRQLARRGVVLLLLGAFTLGLPSADFSLASGGPPQFADLASYLDPHHPDVRRALDENLSQDEALSLLARSMVRELRDPSLLWNNQLGQASPEAQDDWVKSRSVALANHDAWSVPRRPTWAEDPFASAPWQFRYHALGWLLAPAARYQETGEPAIARDVRALVFDWMISNPSGGSRSSFAWYDHAVAYRADVVTYLMAADVLVPENAVEASVLIASLHEHGRVLRRYLDERRFYGHNHNLFHALSLFSLAAAFPQFLDAAEWRERSRERISELLVEMVDTDGVSTEQAISYHYLALDLFAQADRFLEGHGESLDGAERTLLEAMLRFGGVIIQPAGTLPAIGDTNYGSAAPRTLIEQLFATGMTDQQAHFVMSEGTEGERPPDAIFLRQSGYSILRPSYGDVGPWKEDFHLVIDMGPPRRVHGHNDAMSFVLSGAGAEQVIDPGGPYRYGDPRHLDFVSAGAHNTVIVDGQDYGEGSVSLHQTIDVPEYSVVAGSHDLFPDLVHQRTFVLLKPATLLVIDQLDGSGEQHRFDLLLHLPPDARVTLDSSGFRSVPGEAGQLRAAIVGTGSVAVELVEGQQRNPLAFVTPLPGQMLPAPVIRATQSGPSAVFVSVLSTVPDDELPHAALAVDGGDMTVEVRDGPAVWRVRHPRADGAAEPDVEVVKPPEQIAPTR